MPDIARSTCSPRVSRVRKSSPKILIARSAFTPDTVSSMRIAIGCEKLYAIPGISDKALSTASIKSSLVWKRVHSLLGFSTKYVSPSLMPMASVAKSGRQRKADAGREGVQRRHQGQGAEQRPEERGAQSDRHRPEHPSFEALEEQNREVEGDDDDDRERHLPGDLVGRAANRVQRRFLAVMLFQPMHGVLHHHDRTVDDHAEVNRAQAHEVRADAEEPHAKKADEHRKRDDRGS